MKPVSWPTAIIAAAFAALVGLNVVTGPPWSPRSGVEVFRILILLVAAVCFAFLAYRRQPALLPFLKSHGARSRPSIDDSGPDGSDDLGREEGGGAYRRDQAEAGPGRQFLSFRLHRPPHRRSLDGLRSIRIVGVFGAS